MFIKVSELLAFLFFGFDRLPDFSNKLYFLFLVSNNIVCIMINVNNRNTESETVIF